LVEAIAVFLPAISAAPVALIVSSFVVGAFTLGIVPLVPGRIQELLPHGAERQRAALGHATVIAVDDDIDIRDARDVECALATRMEASRDPFVIPDARGHAYVRIGRDGIQASAPARPSRVLPGFSRGAGRRPAWPSCGAACLKVEAAAFTRALRAVQVHGCGDRRRGADVRRGHGEGL
jgi:hypothetical protein